MNYKTGIALLVCLFTGGVGYFLGSYSTEVDYQKILLDQAAQYKAQVEEAKQLENQWKLKAQKADEEYKKQLAAVQQSNDDVVNRLRKQLEDYSSRVSELSKSTSKPDAGTRKTRVSAETKRLIDFSVGCAARLDETIVQLRSLQDWVKKQ